MKRTEKLRATSKG